MNFLKFKEIATQNPQSKRQSIKISLRCTLESFGWLCEKWIFKLLSCSLHFNISFRIMHFRSRQYPLS